jgi:hypothetical protein
MSIDPQWKVREGQPYATISAESWSDFVRLIETHFLDWPEYIYRGQREKSWALRSKFDRWLIDSNIKLENFDPLHDLEPDDRSIVERMSVPETVGNRDNLLSQQLRRFRTACCGRRGPSPVRLSEDEWWSLGRHFGLDTPLLDWTRSPYVACFFAMQGPEPATSGMRSVWAFSHLAMENILTNQVEDTGKREKEVEGIRLLDLPVDENARSISQSGLFTRTPAGEAVEDFVRDRIDLSGFDPVLFRIDLPNRLRESCLRSLESMNINSATLFPDLLGAASYSNRGLEKEYTKIAWELNPEFIKRMISLDATH